MSPATDRPADKAARYLEVEAEILAVLDGEPNVTARMATVASMLADAFEAFSGPASMWWTPDKADELVVGPYQGTLGCLRIAFGRGVCGAAARDRPDPDRRGRPRLSRPHRLRQPLGQRDRGSGVDASGALIAVLDVDATRPPPSTPIDAERWNG